MLSSDGDKIRAFPSRPSPSPCGLTDYTEYSGCNALLIQAVKELYEVPNKPENPIEWLRLYFKYVAEDVAAVSDPSGGVVGGIRGVGGGGVHNKQGSMDSTNSDFTQNPCEVEIKLQQELTQIEADLISCFEAEAQNNAVIEHLEHELKGVTLSSAKNQEGHDDFRRYLDHGEDYHYRIKPDPLYQPSITDMLLNDEENVHQQQQQNDQSGIGGSGGAAQGRTPERKKDDSIVELVPFDPNQWAGDVTARQSEPRDITQKQYMMYEDYPLLYFPERQWKPEEEEEETEVDDEDEETEDQEEEVGEEPPVSEFGGATSISTGTTGIGGSENGVVKKSAKEDSDYDGGSEGGDESDQSKSPRVKSSAPYTPRSAHDNKKHAKASKHSQNKSHHSKQQATTNDKNV